jgi:hypothetical protein
MTSPVEWQHEKAVLDHLSLRHNSQLNAFIQSISEAEETVLYSQVLLPSAVCWLLSAVCWLLAAGCWLLAAGCWLLAAGCWLLAAVCWLLADGCCLSADQGEAVFYTTSVYHLEIH